MTLRVRARTGPSPRPLYVGDRAECANGRLSSNRPSLELSPCVPEVNPEGERGTVPVSSFNPNSCLGAGARTSKEGNGRMPQQGRIVGIDVSKRQGEGLRRPRCGRVAEPSR